MPQGRFVTRERGTADSGGRLLSQAAAVLGSTKDGIGDEHVQPVLIGARRLILAHRNHESATQGRKHRIGMERQRRLSMASG